MLKPPVPDPTLDPFRDGVAVLRRDGQVAGHIAADGWDVLGTLQLHAATSVQSGSFTWDRDDVHHGQYDVEWLPVSQREGVLAHLGISDDDF